MNINRTVDIVDDIISNAYTTELSRMAYESSCIWSQIGVSR